MLTICIYSSAFPLHSLVSPSLSHSSTSTLQTTLSIHNPNLVICTTNSLLSVWICISIPMSSSPFMTWHWQACLFFFIIYLCLEVHLVMDIILFCFCYTTIMCLPMYSTFELYFYLCFNGTNENTPKSCKRVSSVIDTKKISSNNHYFHI